MSKKKSSPGGLVYSTDPSFRPYEEEHEPQETLPPAKQQLKIILDKKHRGGKIVTLVDGFIGTEEDLETLGKQLKTFCGTGGSVKDGQIIIQGDQRQKVADFLKKHDYKHRMM